MVASLTNAVDSAGMMHSPSMVMFDRGVWMAEGLMMGAESMQQKLGDAFTAISDFVISVFADLRDGVLAEMDATVSGIEGYVSEAENAMASLKKTATSVGGIEPGDRDKKDRQYERDARRMDEADGRRTDEERDARRAQREERDARRAGKGGDTYNVTLKDEKDLERWVKRKKRETDTSAGRSRS
jgi:hypothetical protein